MNEYYLVRHGTTVSNEKGIFMGTLDIPLNEKGISEALKLRDKLKFMHFDIAYSSPLVRAYQTAVIVLGMAEPINNGNGIYTLCYYKNEEILHKIPLHIEPKLAERNFGDLTGIVKKDFEKKFPQYKGRKVNKSFNDKPNRGENFRDLDNRLVRFFNDLEKQQTNKKIIIFTHNGPLRIARKYLEGLSEEETLRLNNPHCEIMKYKFEKICLH